MPVRIDGGLFLDHVNVVGDVREQANVVDAAGDQIRSRTDADDMQGLFRADDGRLKDGECFSSPATGAHRHEAPGNEETHNCHRDYDQKRRKRLACKPAHSRTLAKAVLEVARVLQGQERFRGCRTIRDVPGGR